jgi:hypothetical protein
MEHHHYQEVNDISKEEAEHALRLDEPERLRRAVVSVALHAPDRDFAERFCVAASTHTNDEVRGNAILGFGHIARRFGVLSPEIRGVIERGLSDPSEYVRGHSWAAASDAGQFLHWEILEDENPPIPPPTQLRN